MMHSIFSSKARERREVEFERPARPQFNLRIPAVGVFLYLLILIVATGIGYLLWVREVHLLVIILLFLGLATALVSFLL